MNRQKGITLAQLMITVTILGIVASWAYPTFLANGIDCKNKERRISYAERARITNAIGLVGEVHIKIERHMVSHRRLPADLSELNLSSTVDPWGNPYVYLDHSTVNGHGPKRKFHSNVPVNKGYDIYSMGPDGKTATPFTSIPGGDDIVMAGNGQYVGIACYYYSKQSH